ncbi:MAG: ribosome biogenesis GTPase Der [Candidatus Binatia bacterium]
MTRESIPTVAIVGRPNVGKSTLFNRLVRKRRAITLDTPGVTRDAIFERVRWEGRDLLLVDTGGLGGETEIALAQQVHDHTLASIRDADLVVVLFDARAGLNPLDADTVGVVVRTAPRAIYVVNKADGRAQEEAAVEFCRLGIDPPLAVSAEHGIGISELRSAILANLPETSEGQICPTEIPGTKARRVAIVGRPNVGKSSFINRVSGRTLSLVDDAPGTTRDVLDLDIERDGRLYTLLDTAGMRRPSRVARGVEKLSVGRSLQAIGRCDVALLMVEPGEGVTDQDARIANVAWQEGRALVMVVNKADLLPSRGAKEELRRRLDHDYPTLRNAELVFMSVLGGRGISDCLAAIDRAYNAHNTVVQTSFLNGVIADAAERNPPPVMARQRLRLFYATQTACRPPTFSIFVNRTAIPVDYQRYLERQLRETIELKGSPLRLRFKRRPSHGPHRT